MEIKGETLRLIKSTGEQINAGDKYTYLFNVDFSEVSTDFKGTFIVRYPNQYDRMLMGLKRAEMASGLELDVTTDNLIHMFSTLDTILIKKPEWFDISNPEISYEMIIMIYKEYAEWVGNFRNKNTGSDSKGDSVSTDGTPTVGGTEEV